MAFTMLPEAWEERVLKTVQTHLLTPCGLRTLSPQDPQYHGFYGGSQFKRDMAYHQGTTWVFPMGAYLRACLKVCAEEGATHVKQVLSHIEAMLEEGCVGQLPEIYDGDFPKKGKGCYAQAWSVGEILRVYEELEKERKE
jgi:glycogen debranching enzyme